MEPSIQKKKSTARDVARKAGVSLTTVSRFLNDPKAVARPTQQRIFEAIEALSFRPSAAGRAINSGRTKIFGALIYSIDNAIFARVLLGLEQEFARLGYSLVVATTDGDPKVEARKARELVNIGAEGLIVSGISHREEFLEMVTRMNLPVVSISYFDSNYVIPTIGYDNHFAGQSIAQHLMGLGHRKIAVIHGPEDTNDRVNNRLQGILDLSNQAEFSFFRTDLSVGGGSAAVSRILSEAPDVTACLCVSDILALGASFELQRRGVQVPDQMSLTGMEAIAMTEFMEPPLTSVRMSSFNMGVETAKALSDWVENDRRPASVKMPIDVIARASTAAPRR